eukprot:763741-Hanusia_phi.AAC.1
MPGTYRTLPGLPTLPIFHAEICQCRRAEEVLLAGQDRTNTHSQTSEAELEGQMSGPRTTWKPLSGQQPRARPGPQAASRLRGPSPQVTVLKSVTGGKYGRAVGRDPAVRRPGRAAAVTRQLILRLRQLEEKGSACQVA